MCLAPVLVKNPNFGSPIKSDKYHKLHNTTDSYIPVPCGRCSSCIHLKQVYLIQRVQMEAINNDLFFGTLTYNESSLPKAKFGDIEFAYPDFSDWQKMIKMIRKNFPHFKFKYMLVTEYGGKRHRPHFHFILSFPKESDKMAVKVGRAYDLFKIFLSYWRRNVAPDVWSPKLQKFRPNTRSPIWQPLCTYQHSCKSYNYDLHYLDPNSSKDGVDGVAFYVTKYLLKYDDWIDRFKSKLFFDLEEEDYKKAWSLLRPRCLLSKGFGSPDDLDVQNHILKGINIALQDTKAFFPFFVSRINGSTYPLSPYYSKKFLSESSQLIFIERRPDTILTDDDISDFDKQQIKLDETRSFLKNQISLFDYDDIDNINSIYFDYGQISKDARSDSSFANSWQDFDDSDNSFS